LIDQVEEVESVETASAIAEAPFRGMASIDLTTAVQLEPEPEIEPEIEIEIEIEPEAETELPSPKPAPVYRATDIQNSEDWISIYQQLPLEGMLKSICGQLSFRQRDADSLILDIDQAASGVLSDKYQSRFCKLLSQHLGRELQVQIESQENTNESPTRRVERLYREALDAAEKDLVGSEAAQKLGQAFNAQLVPGSVSLK
tara:strand:+ start:38482 stop:39084 length:603 start_codon:yes stop_codon:yes gene_type:complete